MQERPTSNGPLICDLSDELDYANELMTQLTNHIKKYLSDKFIYEKVANSKNIGPFLKTELPGLVEYLSYLFHNKTTRFTELANTLMLKIDRHLPKNAHPNKSELFQKLTNDLKQHLSENFQTIEGSAAKTLKNDYNFLDYDYTPNKAKLISETKLVQFQLLQFLYEEISATKNDIDDMFRAQKTGPILSKRKKDCKIEECEKPELEARCTSPTLSLDESTDLSPDLSRSPSLSSFSDSNFEVEEEAKVQNASNHLLQKLQLSTSHSEIFGYEGDDDHPAQVQLQEAEGKQNYSENDRRMEGLALFMQFSHMMQKQGTPDKVLYLKNEENKHWEIDTLLQVIDCCLAAGKKFSFGEGLKVHLGEGVYLNHLDSKNKDQDNLALIKELQVQTDNESHKTKLQQLYNQYSDRQHSEFKKSYQIKMKLGASRLNDPCYKANLEALQQLNCYLNCQSWLNPSLAVKGIYSNDRFFQQKMAEYKPEPFTAYRTPSLQRQ